MELEDDMRLDLPKMACWFRARIPMGMDQTTCQWGSISGGMNVIEEGRCARQNYQA
jgi:hypothetical protein